MANLVQTNKPLFIPLLAFTTIFLMLFNKVHSSDSLSFTFNSFNPDQKDLILQGNAKVLSTNTLQLTGSTIGTVGRALYSAPVHLWEQSTGKVARFESTFTFVLKLGSSHPSDGLTFFIAPTNTTIPPGSSGGLLGLFTPENKLNPSKNQVVAVEFDTFIGNEWDPSYRHIGIDVNSIRSSEYTKWDRRDGVIATVHITYTPATEILSVVSSYPDQSQDYKLSHNVDFKIVLPEWVRIGFSASTGDDTQTHQVLSWSFTSTLESNEQAKEEDMYNIVNV